MEIELYNHLKKNPIHFRFSEPDDYGNRLISATSGELLLAEERFDVSDLDGAKAFLKSAASCLPAGETDERIDTVYDAYQAAVRKLPKLSSMARQRNPIRQHHTPREIIPAKPFPVRVLPGIVGEYVCEAAAAIGCCVSFLALPVLACLARAIGNKRVIRLKRSWCEPAILWVPSSGKAVRTNHQHSQRRRRY